MSGGAAARLGCRHGASRRPHSALSWKVKMKTHDRDVFFKYATAETAKLILRDLTLRWSSPAVFNDPFDTQLDLQFGFEPDEFIEPMQRAFGALVFADEEPTWVLSEKIGPVVRMLRLVRHKLSRDEFVRQAREGLAEGTRDVVRTLGLVRDSWPEYVRRMRVLCVGEEHDNILMWSHYAYHHRGVAITLRCIPERDTPLCAAKPIIYSSTIPVVAGLDEYVRHCTGESRLAFDQTFFDLTFTKSAHWSYEREWRCWVLARPGEEGGLWEANVLEPEEVDSVYLGCRIVEDDRNAILGLVESRLKHVKVFQGRIERRLFALAFDQIR